MGTKAVKVGTPIDPRAPDIIMVARTFQQHVLPLTQLQALSHLAL